MPSSLFVNRWNHTDWEGTPVDDFTQGSVSRNDTALCLDRIGRILKAKRELCPLKRSFESTWGRGLSV